MSSVSIFMSQRRVEMQTTSAMAPCFTMTKVELASERDTLRSVQLKIGDIYIMVRATSVYSAGVPYAARFTAAVKIPLPLATFQF